MTLDGQKQRNALTGAEQALRALGDGQSERARKNAGKAVDLDQLGLFTGFPEAVGSAADDIDRGGTVTAASWDALEQLVGPGPLQFLIEELRTA